ncbi:MAG TPA: hypothetical protein VLS45_04465 [Methylomicrobium sp.]|nr:hypothetical protein [Methylomicrobium sp.]
MTCFYRRNRSTRPTVGQGKAGTLGGQQPAAYFESMWRGVVLHLRTRLKMIASGPLLCRDAQLILTDQPGQALVGDGDIIPGRQLLLHPDNIALTVAEEFANLFDVLVISRLLADRWSGYRRLEHFVHRVAGDFQLFGDHPLGYPVFRHFPDHLLFDGVDHIQDAP